MEEKTFKTWKATVRGGNVLFSHVPSLRTSVLTFICRNLRKTRIQSHPESHQSGERNVIFSVLNGWSWLKALIKEAGKPDVLENVTSSCHCCHCIFGSLLKLRHPSGEKKTALVVLDHEIQPCSCFILFIFKQSHLLNGFPNLLFWSSSHINNSNLS